MIVLALSVARSAIFTLIRVHISVLASTTASARNHLGSGKLDRGCALGITNSRFLPLIRLLPRLSSSITFSILCKVVHLKASGPRNARVPASRIHFGVGVLGARPAVRRRLIIIRIRWAWLAQCVVLVGDSSFAFGALPWSVRDAFDLDVFNLSCHALRQYVILQVRVPCVSPLESVEARWHYGAYPLP